MSPLRPALAAVLLGLPACVPDTLPSSEEVGPYHGGMPSITSVEWDCDTSDALWSLQVETEGWTGGGRWYLTRDGSLVESHLFYSDEADGDGAWDRLSLQLDVAEDWTDASSGSSTAFRCADQDELSFLVVVYGPKGSNVGDCRIWGAEPALWATAEGVPGCEVELADD